MGEIVRNLRIHGGLPAGTAVTIDNALKETLSVNMDDADDVSGGGNTQTVGFTVRDFTGAAVDYEVVLEFAAFDDIDLSIPATNAALSGEAEGTILAGTGTAALKIKTDSSGRFSCLVTDGADEDVFFGCNNSFGSAVMDCREKDSVTFSA